jgi:class 3 adenylate cyclase
MRPVMTWGRDGRDADSSKGDEMFLEELGRRIRERREIRGLKQLDIANALQISPQAVSKWERGENAPDIIVIGPLSRILGVTTDWILGCHDAPGNDFEATVFASSVLGATARSETMDMRDIAAWSNGLFYQLTEVVLRYGGVPVKYIGDGFLSFFADDSHNSRALQAAISARESVPDRLVIGLSSGPILLAVIGHPSYARPDVLGHTVNRAFRVLSWVQSNSQCRIGASNDTLQDLNGVFEFGEGNNVVLKGISESVIIREVVSARASC